MFIIESPTDPDYGENLRTMTAYRILGRDEAGGVESIRVYWPHTSTEYTGFLARMAWDRIRATLIRAKDEPKAEGAP